MSHLFRRGTTAAAITLVIALASLPSSAAAAVVIDFDEHPHGQVMNEQYAPIGMHISAMNLRGGPHVAMAFNTHLPNTADDDLEDEWNRGNLRGTNLATALVIAEDATDDDGDDIIDRPDDQRASDEDQPAGELTLRFDYLLDSIGFDLLDIDGDHEIGPDVGYVSFRLAGPAGVGIELARVGFDEFKSSASPHYNPTVRWGNNSANRIDPISASSLNLRGFNEVTFRIASGAVDTIQFTPIPEPALAGPLVLAAATLLARRRRPRA